MNSGRFCFLSEQYYIDFPDKYLMKNKEVIDGIAHDRPCFFAFQDTAAPDIYWLVPISSNYIKYKALYDKKVQRYGRCNTIRFGTVLNRQAAFLIQNMCPVTMPYISALYIDKNGAEIRIDDRIAQDIITHAREVLALAKRGVQIIFPDVKAILSQLQASLKLSIKERTTMKILLLCDDHYHPGNVPDEGLALLKPKGFDIDVIYDAGEFDPARLGDYAVVVMSKCDHKTLADNAAWKTPAVQDAFMAYVENGGGLLVTHSGTVAGEGTQQFDEFVGCKFHWHPADCPTTVDVIKPHPIGAGVKAFTEVDEHYHLTITAPEADIFLASYAAAQGDMAKVESEPYFNAVAAVCAAGYTLARGKGRVCVLTPGHTLAVWHNPQYQLTLENALRWCAGK